MFDWARLDLTGDGVGMGVVAVANVVAAVAATVSDDCDDKREVVSSISVDCIISSNDSSISVNSVIAVAYNDREPPTVKLSNTIIDDGMFR